MSDAVLDTTVVAFENADLLKQGVADSVAQCIRLLEDAVERRVRIRFNQVLLNEYQEHVKRPGNDVIEAFFQLLDSASAVRVKRNALARHLHQRAFEHRWPRHDEHLLAAAIDGEDPSIYVTDQRLARCAAGILRAFRIRVHQV